MAAEIDLKTYKPAETVPPELLKLAEAHYSMHGNGLLFNLIAAVLPAHEAMVRERVAQEIEAWRCEQDAKFCGSCACRKDYARIARGDTPTTRTETS